jgi:hypothetical protein
MTAEDCLTIAPTPFRPPDDPERLPCWSRFSNVANHPIHPNNLGGAFSRASGTRRPCLAEHSTVEGIVSLLGRILGDAVEDDLLPANPVHHHRNRGKRAFRIPHEMLWATPEEVLRGAGQAEQLQDRASAVLIITAAWTGCRWASGQGKNTLLRHTAWSLTQCRVPDRRWTRDWRHGSAKQATTLPKSSRSISGSAATESSVAWSNSRSQTSREFRRGSGRVRRRAGCPQQWRDA